MLPEHQLQYYNLRSYYAASLKYTFGWQVIIEKITGPQPLYTIQSVGVL